MSQEKNIQVLEEKYKHLEDKCQNIFDQLTELRTSIQEMYGENAECERRLYAQMLDLSKRMEALAKEINPSSSNTTVNLSPQINPSIEQNPNINSPDIYNTPSNDGNKKSFMGLDLDNMMTVGIAAIVGFIILLGLGAVFAIKLFSALGALFN